MAAVDHFKEQIAYLRLWCGVDPSLLLRVVGLVAISGLSIAVLLIHRVIQKRIEQLGKV